MTCENFPKRPIRANRLNAWPPATGLSGGIGGRARDRAGPRGRSEWKAGDVRKCPRMSRKKIPARTMSENVRKCPKIKNPAGGSLGRARRDHRGRASHAGVAVQLSRTEVRRIFTRTSGDLRTVAL